MVITPHGSHVIDAYSTSHCCGTLASSRFGNLASSRFGKRGQSRQSERIVASIIQIDRFFSDEFVVPRHEATLRSVTPKWGKTRIDRQSEHVDHIERKISDSRTYINANDEAT